MKTTATLLLTLPILLLSGCASLDKFIASPTGQGLIGAAEKAGLEAIGSGKFDGKKFASDALSGAATELRTKQEKSATAQPANSPQAAAEAKTAATAATTAVKEGTGSKTVANKVAPPVADAVAKAVKEGHPSNFVLEAAARGLDKAAASVKK
jgi:hypothetical protein